jgi:predicted GNAT family acetyltransferase
MGKYFAEPKYKNEMPYLSNKEGSMWILAFEDNGLIAFASLHELKNKIILEHSYVEENHRKKGIWKKLNELRFKYASDKNKPIEVITKEDHLKEYWIKNGFEVYRQNGRYFYLRKEIKDDKGSIKAVKG